MPVRTGFAIPISLNPDGNTISNLRNATLVDYVKPSRTWTIDAGTVASAATANGTWGLTLPNCFRLAAYTKISTPILVASGTFTLMMRVRIPTLSVSPIGATDVIFTNGQNRYIQVFYRYDISDPENPVHSLKFTESQTGGGTTVTLTTGVAGGTWYHIAIVYASPKIYTYLNGVAGPELDVGGIAPWDTSSYFGLDVDNTDILDITDFVMFKKDLSSTQIANYAAAPFI